MTELPKVIYLQVYGDGDKSAGLPDIDADVTWHREQVFDTDVRYILDRRFQPNKRKKKPSRSEG